jgi:hypothetical protein
MCLLNKIQRPHQRKLVHSAASGALIHWGETVKLTHLNCKSCCNGYTPPRNKSICPLLPPHRYCRSILYVPYATTTAPAQDNVRYREVVPVPGARCS